MHGANMKIYMLSVTDSNPEIFWEIFLSSPIIRNGKNLKACWYSHKFFVGTVTSFLFQILSLRCSFFLSIMLSTTSGHLQYTKFFKALLCDILVTEKLLDCFTTSFVWSYVWFIISLHRRTGELPAFNSQYIAFFLHTDINSKVVVLILLNVR